MTITSEIEAAVKLLRMGGLVAFPTETVYGLGADAKNPAAVQKVFAVKKRPLKNPLIVHLADFAAISEWAREIPAALHTLADNFWPGPLTVILKKQPHVLDIVTGGQDTIALRIPSHPVAQNILRAFGGGLVGPSANLFTRLSPTTAKAVREELGNNVDMVLDGGECEVGLESTIIDMSLATSGDATSGDRPMILRPGMISRRAIEQVLKTEVLSCTEKALVRAPGMYRVHYAPQTPLMLVASESLVGTLSRIASNKKRVVALVMTEAFAGSCLVENKCENFEFIQMPKGAKDYAKHLYRQLRNIDQQQHYQQIVIEMVPDDDDWSAIRDRLLKASART